MATYLEIRELWLDSELRNKAEAALGISASNLSEVVGVTPDDQAWIGKALGETTAGSEAIKALKFILSENNTSSVEQIKNAPDSVIQSNVDQIVPTLVAAYAVERLSSGGA